MKCLFLSLVNTIQNDINEELLEIVIPHFISELQLTEFLQLEGIWFGFHDSKKGKILKIFASTPSEILVSIYSFIYENVKS